MFTYQWSLARRHLRCTAGFILAALFALGTSLRSARAVDRDWNQTSGTQVFNMAANWTPNGIPMAGDNLTFPLNGDVDIFLGAPSVGSNITFSDGIVEFLDVGNSALNNGGAVRIDDPTAINLAEGAFVTLSGGTISWTSVGDATIGSAGAGTLTVNNGGDFRADQFLIGDGATGRGEVTVTGAGSTLTASLNSNVSLYAIGVHGGTGTLHVLAGADLTTTSTTTGDISIGEGAGSVGTLNIDGVGSTAESEDIWVGHGGTGFLNITNGGVINLTDATAPNRNLEIARSLLATGDIGNGSVLVSGDNSLLSVGTLNVGATGAGTATISAGGRITAGADSLIGNQTGSNGMLTVTGVGTLADSTFAVTGNLLVGQLGQGTLRAELGGNVTVSSNLVIGDDITNTSDNRVTVAGAGSLLTVGNRLVVSNEGVGNNTPGSETTNSLSITDGASASAVFLRVAEIAGSKGEILVEGAESSFSSTTDAAIGTRGTGSVEVSAGGNLMNGGAFWVGFDGAGLGNVRVTGAGSVLQANGVASSASTLIGGHTTTSGGVGSVTVENGGQMHTAANVYLGGNAAGDGTLLVTGPGSHVDSDDGGSNEVTYVGYANRGSFTIADGASVASELVRIGELATVAVGEAAATVTGVDGTPSTWNVGGTLFVGDGGVGSLQVIAGGQVISNTAASANSMIGNGAASDGSSVVIDGAGSKWTDAGGLAGAGTDLYIGNSGGSVALPTTLTIQNGGALETGRGVIARLTGSRADVVITGDGSRWDATSILVGNLSTGSLTVSDGADVSSTGDVIVAVGINAAQRGIGVATVAGPGSTLSSNALLVVGNANTTVGTLHVADGGTVMNSGHGVIASAVGSTGTVNVGNGSAMVSTWSGSASLFVGGSNIAGGGNGLLNINSGGSVSVVDELKVWAGGDVVLNGGDLGGLQLTTLTRVAGSTFDFQSGKLSFANNAGNNRILDAAALTAIFNAEHTITAGKTLQILGPVTLSAPLRVNGGSFALASVKPGNEAAFAANLDWDSGTLQFTSSGLTVGNAGLFGPTLVVDADQTLLVGQSLIIDSSAEFVIAGGLASAGLANNGDLVAVGATINGPLVNNSAVTVVGTVDFNGPVSGPGDFFGPGTANFNGGLSPGASPAEVVFEGSVSLEESNSLSIELAGRVPGTEFDVLNIAGAATLDGHLDVRLLHAFAPADGDLFPIVQTDGGIFGTFVSQSLPNLAPGLAWRITYGELLVALEVVTGGLPGDTNGDQVVDLTDLNNVRNNFGGLGLGDTTPFDGDVDLDDLNAVRNNFGAAANSLTVPEPSTYGLCAACSALLGYACPLCGRRFRRSS